MRAIQTAGRDLGLKALRGAGGARADMTAYLFPLFFLVVLTTRNFVVGPSRFYEGFYEFPIRTYKNGCVLGLVVLVRQIMVC